MSTLDTLEPKSGAGKVRSRLTEIRAALARGVLKKDIAAALGMTPQAFTNALSRIEKTPASGDTPAAVPAAVLAARKGVPAAQPADQPPVARKGGGFAALVELQQTSTAENKDPRRDEFDAVQQTINSTPVKLKD